MKNELGLLPILSMKRMPPSHIKRQPHVPTNAERYEAYRRALPAERGNTYQWPAGRRVIEPRAWKWEQEESNGRTK